METKTTFRIPEYNYSTFRSRIDALNKRANRLGVPAIKLSVVEEYFDVWHVDGNTNAHWPVGSTPTEPCWIKRTGRVFTYYVVTVEGATPKFDGWEFIATIEHTGAGNIFHCKPGVDTHLAEYRECQPSCDHCKVNRYRRDTFVLRHEDGSQKQIGRSCLKDFLGHANPLTLAAQAEIHFSAGELAGEAEYEREHNAPRTFSTDVFLAHVSHFVRSRGYTSRKAEDAARYGVRATASLAYNNLFPPSQDFQPEPVSDEDTAYAVKAREYVLESLNKPDLTDFEHNILVAAKCEVLEPRTAGLAAYIVEHYRRATEACIETKPSEFFGEIGKRYCKQGLTFKSTSSFDSQFGVCYFHRFLTDDGNLVVWKTSNNVSAETGRKFVADYSIKSHEDYKGTKQTYITRVKFYEAV